MRILFFNNLYKPFGGGGAELIVSYLAERLVQNGHEVYVATILKNELTKKNFLWETIENVNVIRYFPPNIYWSSYQNGVSTAEKMIWHAIDAWNKKSALLAEKLINKIQPDIVHTHNIDGFSPAIWEKIKKKDIPLLHTAHDSHQLCVKSTLLRSSGELCLDSPAICRLYRSWYASKSRLVDYFITPSKFLYHQFQSSSFKAQNMRVVQNGIPLQADFDKKRFISVRRNNTIGFLFIGRLEESKGLMDLLKSMEILKQENDLRLEIAGAGPLEEVVFERQEIDPRINFHGYVSGSQKKKLFEESDIILFPSRGYESFGLGILEGFDNYMPAIATNLSSLPELIDHGQNGYLFERGNPEELSSFMLKFVRNIDLIKSMGKKGKEKSKLFSVEKMTEAYELQYEVSLY